VGEEIDELAGGRFYGIAVGIDSVRLDGSQVPGGKNADLAIKWRYRDPTHDPARARPPRHRARPGYRRGARRILPTPLPLPGLAECRRGLFTALASWRTMAVRLARSPEERARQEAAAVLAQVPEELRPGPEQDEATRWMADPSRLLRVCDAAVPRLVALPAATPSLRLLADQTAELLGGISPALNGLALLVADPARPVARSRGRPPPPHPGLASSFRQCRAHIRGDRRG